MKVSINLRSRRKVRRKVRTKRASSTAQRVRRITTATWSEPVEFSSRNLQSSRYNEVAKQLEITFNGGGTYIYTDVPVHVWDTLRSAASPGGYFSRIIKPSYIGAKTSSRN